MELSLFDYQLPASSVAQEPAEPRDSSRLLVLHRATGRWEDRRFAELPLLLRAGDCVVVNDSRVIPARLLGSLEPGGRPAELLLLREIAPDRWEALGRPGRRLGRGARVSMAGGLALATVLETGPGGVRVVEFVSRLPVREVLERHGLPPLPPYIERHGAPRLEDRERYQTVYAARDGSVAAPTAGLHFTPQLLARLGECDVELHRLTLHVGPGTFRPLRATQVDAHRMDPEEVEIPEATAAAVTRAKRQGRRVVAVGTTTTRALEWAAGPAGQLRGGVGRADLFIRPGHPFRVVDALVTNFHLPRSTLLVLVAALAGRALILEAYRHAAAAGYRFYSYGDAMLIE